MARESPTFLMSVLVVRLVAIMLNKTYAMRVVLAENIPIMYLYVGRSSLLTHSEGANPTIVKRLEHMLITQGMANIPIAIRCYLFTVASGSVFMFGIFLFVKSLNVMGGQ